MKCVCKQKTDIENILDSETNFKSFLQFNSSNDLQERFNTVVQKTIDFGKTIQEHSKNMPHITVFKLEQSTFNTYKDEHIKLFSFLNLEVES